VPSVIEVTLDEVIKREIPVQVDWAGELPAGLILSEINIDPEKVEVIGGKRILQKLSTIYTEKIHLDNLKESGAIFANLALTPASLNIAPGSKDKVRITYVIKPRAK
jgi:diadenylate cyclase